MKRKILNSTDGMGLRLIPTFIFSRLLTHIWPNCSTCKLVTQFLNCTIVNRVTGQELIEILQIQPSLLQTQSCIESQSHAYFFSEHVLLL